MTDEEIDQQKDIEFYAASVNAFYTSALEHDKSIFTLAAGGIGLLMTLLTTIGTNSIWVLVFYGLALVCFLTSLLLLLKIFRKNNEHIVEIFQGVAQVEDTKLKKLDDAVRASFGYGLIFAVVVGVLSALNSYQDKSDEARSKREKEKMMANDNQSKNTTRNIANESFNGVSNLTKSFNNVSSLKPQAATSTQNSSPPSTPPQGNSGPSKPSGNGR